MPDGLCFSLKWEADCALPERGGDKSKNAGWKKASGLEYVENE